MQVPGFTTTYRVNAGTWDTCASKNDGSLWCWGDNSFGQLGNSSYPNGDSGVPVRTSGFGAGRTATQIAAGANHTCVRANDGSVWCWGSGGFNQMGNGGTSSSDPVQVSFGAGITASRLFAGGNTTCALTSDTFLTCWGRNNKGQIGNGTTQASSGVTPTAVTGVPSTFTVSDVEVGDQHVCAVVSGGAAVRCWGYDNKGQLGTVSDGNTDKSTATPTDSVGGTARSVSAGTQFTCVTLTDNSASCFGNNANGQLGRGSLPPSTASAPGTTSVAGAINKVVTGANHACALMTAGTVQCWGSSSVGQVGNGTTSSSLIPVAAGTFAAMTSRSAVPPTAVSGVTFVSRTETSIGLAWNALTSAETDNVALLNYAVEVSNNGVDWTRSLIAPGSTSTTVTGLVSATAYFVRVAGVNAAGVGTFSADVSMRTSALPDQVTGVTFVSRTPTSMSVAWTEPLADGLPILSYKVEWTTGTAAWQPAVVVGATSYTMSALTSASTYRIRVSATSAAGTGLPSAELADRTSNPPDMVTGLVHVNRTESSISISWVAPAADGLVITEYEVQTFLGASLNPVTTLVSGVTPSTTITGLLPNSTYRIRVRAISEIGRAHV